MVNKKSNPCIIVFHHYVAACLYDLLAILILIFLVKTGNMSNYDDDFKYTSFMYRLLSLILVNARGVIYLYRKLNYSKSKRSIIVTIMYIFIMGENVIED